MSKQLTTIPFIGDRVSIQGDLMPAFNTIVVHVGVDPSDRGDLGILVEYNVEPGDEFATSEQYLPTAFKNSGLKYLWASMKCLYEPEEGLKVLAYPYLQTRPKPTKWEECGRDDLRFIPAMIAAGWLPRFSVIDVRHGRTTIEHIPHDAVTFSKGIKRVWGTINRETHEQEFTLADLIDDSYQNHERVGSLKDLL